MLAVLIKVSHLEFSKRFASPSFNLDWVVPYEPSEDIGVTERNNYDPKDRVGQWKKRYTRTWH